METAIPVRSKYNVAWVNTVIDKAAGTAHYILRKCRDSAYARNDIIGESSYKIGLKNIADVIGKVKRVIIDLIVSAGGSVVE